MTSAVLVADDPRAGGFDRQAPDPRKQLLKRLVMDCRFEAMIREPRVESLPAQRQPFALPSLARHPCLRTTVFARAWPRARGPWEIARPAELRAVTGFEPAGELDVLKCAGTDDLDEGLKRKWKRARGGVDRGHARRLEPVSPVAAAVDRLRIVHPEPVRIAACPVDCRCEVAPEVEAPRRPDRAATLTRTPRRQPPSSPAGRGSAHNPLRQFRPIASFVSSLTPESRQLILCFPQKERMCRPGSTNAISAGPAARRRVGRFLQLKNSRRRPTRNLMFEPLEARALMSKTAMGPPTTGAGAVILAQRHFPKDHRCIPRRNRGHECHLRWRGPRIRHIWRRRKFITSPASQASSDPAHSSSSPRPGSSSRSPTGNRGYTGFPHDPQSLTVAGATLLEAKEDRAGGDRARNVHHVSRHNLCRLCRQSRRRYAAGPGLRRPAWNHSRCPGHRQRSAPTARIIRQRSLI